LPDSDKGDDGMKRGYIINAVRVGEREGRDVDGKAAAPASAGEAGPLGADALRQVIPLGVDHVPVHQRPL